MLDVCFGEDGCCVRKDNAPQNLSLPRKMAPRNIVRADTAEPRKTSMRLKRKRAGWGRQRAEANALDQAEMMTERDRPEVYGNRVDVYESAVDLPGTSVEVYGTSVEVYGTSVDLHGNAVETPCRKSQRTKRARFWIDTTLAISECRKPLQACRAWGLWGAKMSEYLTHRISTIIFSFYFHMSVLLAWVLLQ